MRAFLLLGTFFMIALGSGCGGDGETTEASRTPTQTQPTASVEAPPPSTTSTPTERADDATPTPTETTPPSTSTDAEPPPAEAGAGSDDEKQAAADVTLGFVAAIAAGDGEGACAAMKGLGQSPAFKGKDCAEILEAVSARYPEQVRKSLSDVRVVRVTIESDSAQVAYRTGSLPKTEMPLVRVDGEWKIGGLAAAAPGAG
jgi:outer membrane biosynthesis protein TonB